MLLMGNCKSYVSVAEPFVLGDTYLITWDGADYECVARNVGGGILVGNENLFGIVSPGTEPFVMYTQEAPDGSGNEVSFTLTIETASEDESHTVAIRHVAVAIRRLDAELLPLVYLNGMEPMTYLEALNYLCGMFGYATNSDSVPFFTGKPVGLIAAEVPPVSSK